MSSVTIRPATAADAAAVAGIYNPYIRESSISFEEQEVDGGEMAVRISTVQQHGLPFLLACREHEVLGYCYATPWRARPAYRFSVEVSIYLAPAAQGQGLGTLLYRQLFSLLSAAGYHLVIAGIAQPNPASVALHEKLGMRQVALFSEVGRKFDRWHDVGYWQLRLAAAECPETATEASAGPG